MPWLIDPPPPLSAPRWGSAAALCEAPAPQSGKWIHAIGGYGPAGLVATVETYDPLEGNAWSPVQDMPTVRSSLAATSTAGLLHALGGVAPAFFAPGYKDLPTHEIYDPASGWFPAPPMPTARRELAAGGE